MNVAMVSPVDLVSHALDLPLRATFQGAVYHNTAFPAVYVMPLWVLPAAPFTKCAGCREHQDRLRADILG
jgi:hypothetical protein